MGAGRSAARAGRGFEDGRGGLAGGFGVGIGLESGDVLERCDGVGLGAGTLVAGAGPGDAGEVVEHRLRSGVVVPDDDLLEAEVQTRGEVNEGLVLVEERDKEVAEGFAGELVDGGAVRGVGGIGGRGVRRALLRLGWDVWLRW